MAKSTTADKPKSKGKAKQPTPPPPASPSSRSNSPSSSSASPSDSSDDDDHSDKGSARSSASPEPEAPKQPARIVDPSLRKYTPPSGFKPLKATVDKGALDWDDLRDDPDLELWAVRVPVGLKTKHLDGLTLTLPPPELGTPSQPVGHLSAKKAEYDAFLTVPTSSTKRKRGEAAPEEAEGAGARAGELAAAVPLVPRKSHGNKLFQAPRPIARTLTLQRALPAGVVTNPTTAHLLKTSHSSLIASQPSPVPGSILDADALLLAPAEIAARKEAVRGKGARDQPDELLVFRLGNFGGMGPEGGKGRYHNPMARVVRAERVEVGEGDEDEERAGAGAGEDVEMADAAAAGGEGADDDDKKKVKQERKDKKERRKSEAAGGDIAESPKKKKKKVKAEES
ncbi:uncharacterized protein RHOBADRAFT_53000 [Rhodotorula graminis WP1]|uniref:DNA-directed RNA polymerase I subunit RPA34 n=1 Tax=Rhodotorula graminis (strain WP1) TaxID=578459 RepID=A0A194S5J7_RHOGW|nr:uncharacterized protein RHOBADRAFT_53000 [Rhodotorula graminis WP1]KPV75998.1 hypothetical protein RHOBADRAFT_53000 [Rhodotorula graminis WP1]